jgi:hypothetical protein
MAIVPAGVVGVVGVVEVDEVEVDEVEVDEVEVDELVGVVDAAVLLGTLLVTWAPEHPPRHHTSTINPARRDRVATSIISCMFLFTSFRAQQLNVGSGASFNCG